MSRDTAGASGGGQRLAWRAATTLAVGVALAALLTGPYRFLSGTVSGSTAAGTRAAPCLPGRSVAVMNSPQISPAQAASVRYDSLPPTSGPHYALTIAPGIYDGSLPEGLTVHAMELGHVIIQYAPTTPENEVAALTRLAKRYGADTVLAPYRKLTRGIAVTAWGRIDLLDHYDESRMSAFVERLRDRYDNGWTTARDCPR